PILVNVFMDKLKQFQIDENGNILKTTVKTTDIYSLFYTEKIIKIDEVGEPMYDDEGDQIYITSRTPIFTTDILGIEFHEDWYLAKNSFQLKKEVKGIVLLIGDYDDKGVLRGLKKIPAYISFED
ncbi:MAG: hypothetical protein ACPGVD_09105, partial [Flavobacteriales bacterium]